VKKAKFVAAARREFLAEVIYYNKEQPGLGARFAAAVEEATARAVAFPLPIRPHPKVRGASSSKTSRLRSCTGQSRTVSSYSCSRITRVDQGTGNRECRNSA